MSLTAFWVAFPVVRIWLSNLISYAPFWVVMLAIVRIVVPTVPVVGSIDVMLVAAWTVVRRVRVMITDDSVRIMSAVVLTVLGRDLVKYFPSCGLMEFVNISNAGFVLNFTFVLLACFLLRLSCVLRGAGFMRFSLVLCSGF